MSSTHCIVVWEWQSEGQWLPHTPGVTRTLERAHAKKLTRVVLADADPALKGHYVNLRTLTQCVDSPDGSSTECLVRRAVYDLQTPGGRGVRWEWAPLMSPPPPMDSDYEPMPMEMQCVVEAAYVGGGGAVWGGWRVSPLRLAAVGPRGLRLLRRALLPPYPRAPPPPAPAPPALPPAPARPMTTARRVRIPQQHTGSSVQSVQSVQSLPAPAPAPTPAPAHAPAPQPRSGARSASPPRKHGLARQILHNLKIFSNNNKPPAPAPAPSPPETPADTHTTGSRSGRSGRSGRASGRRHSVDTVSTYLSHESKDSLQRGSVGELLDCSAGSDDVFECAPDVPSPAESWARGAGAGAGAGAGPAWGAVCPSCLHQLRAGSGLLRLPQPSPTHPREQQDELYIECLICGEVHDKDGSGEEGEGVWVEGVCGPQPSGSMAWCVQPTALPAFPRHATILVTYTFQSGVQCAGHPRPGAPYYAVGFPRHTLLPDTEPGREVLCLLRAAWAAGLLFGVSASRTTGREHVVCWRLGPPAPPAHAAHYPPRASPAAAKLQRLRNALHRLLPQPPAAAHSRPLPPTGSQKQAHSHWQHLFTSLTHGPAIASLNHIKI